MVSVTAGSGCSWAAVAGVPWIVVSGGSSGVGNGAVVYAVTANTGSSLRSGSITIGGQTFAITQAGAVTTGCSYSLPVTTSSFTAQGGAGSMAVSASPGCKWTASSQVSWIWIMPSWGSSGTSAKLP